MSFDLASFSLLDMLQCGKGIRAAAADAASADEAASRIVDYLYSELRSESAAAQRPALVRFYKTQPFGSLEPRLRAFALSKMGASPAKPEMRCLTLLATAGQKPEWCEPDGELFAVVIFARGPIPADSASRFRNIALDVKAVIHPFARPDVTYRPGDLPD